LATSVFDGQFAAVLASCPQIRAADQLTAFGFNVEA
jgi:hypothetical protein